MEVLFKTQSWKTKIERGRYFKNNNKLNQQLDLRISQLEASDNLAIVKMLPQLRLHKLHGNKSLKLAIDINGKTNPNRIVFTCSNGDNIHDDRPNPKKLASVTKIEIVQIGDYH